MKINLDPVMASRLKAAWAALPAAKRAQLLPAMEAAGAQAELVAKTGLAPGKALPHTLALAHSALTDDSKQVVDTLEAGIVVTVGGDGVIWGTGKWEQLDPGWIESLVVFLENLVTGKAPFNTNPQTIAIPDDVLIAIAGDWGTGNWRTPSNPAPSTNVGAALASQQADITIHLGDVYYAGTSDEEKHLLIPLWPQGKLGSFTMNSNHEMYSAAKPYFAAINNAPFDKQQGCSYFALENTNWIIVALDSAYYSPDENLYMGGSLYPNNTPNEQITFLKAKVAAAIAGNKKLILLTHHNSLDDTGTTPNTLFNQVAPVLPAGVQVYWYYGHEHFAAVYMPQGDVLCRCCGHGAIPQGNAPDLAASANVIWYEHEDAGDPDISQRVMNGFATLKLSGSNIIETFYNEKGAKSWASS